MGSTLPGLGPILKYRLYYSSGMVRPTDQKGTAIEKITGHTYKSQEEGARQATRAAWGSTGVRQEAEGEGDPMGKCL